MEIVVISGKGGTGKTTVATALSHIAGDVIRVDCDVDAPNFYLYYFGKEIFRKSFYALKVAKIDNEICIKCGKCEEVCKFDAISNFEINEFSCEGCAACKYVCPVGAVSMHERKIADTYVKELEDGIITGAEMEIGADGSGKLITFLRKKAKEFQDSRKIMINDGSPGIGCAVISSVTGCDYSLIITEPTMSGLEDLKRVTELCRHFTVPIMVCINKYDINIDFTEEIESFCITNGYSMVGKIPFDSVVVKSINELKPVTYYSDSEASAAIYNMWKKIKKITLQEE